MERVLPYFPLPYISAHNSTYSSQKGKLYANPTPKNASEVRSFNGVARLNAATLNEFVKNI